MSTFGFHGRAQTERTHPAKPQNRHRAGARWHVQQFPQYLGIEHRHPAHAHVLCLGGQLRALECAGHAG